jgi:hypothetical protein
MFAATGQSGESTMAEIYHIKNRRADRGRSEVLLREERHTSPAATWAKMLTTEPAELRILRPSAAASTDKEVKP